MIKLSLSIWSKDFGNHTAYGVRALMRVQCTVNRKQISTEQTVNLTYAVFSNKEDAVLAMHGFRNSIDATTTKVEYDPEVWKDRELHDMLQKLDIAAESSKIQQERDVSPELPIMDAVELAVRDAAAGKSYGEIAIRIGRNVPFVNLLIEIDDLPDTVKELLRSRKISVSHAEAMIKKCPPSYYEAEASNMASMSIAAFKRHLTLKYSKAAPRNLKQKK
jgi:hypothetical protein